ncbi:hypothetical protein Rmf_01300 [Roseomonas fluvialis]|uniref:Glycosyltransferase 61 catalytic domain-containing protein n=2 Tax=Roseomonas fluvialis TaxID=1750527 RepID=A0ABM7XXJ0_9PROT|nr:hypothetical protein Rmf_01300 [Roseomonas fluvialis]
MPEEILTNMRRRARRFDWHSSFSRPAEPAVLEDVFCNSHGQVWTAAGTMLRGGAWPLPEESARAMAYAPLVDDLAYARGGEAQRNFFHWMAESLPSIARVLDPNAPPQMPIGIMPHPPRFVLESLLLAAREGFSVVRLGDALRVRRLHTVPIGVWSLLHREAHAAMFERMVDRAVAAVPDLPQGDRIFITRADSARRPALNEKMLAAALTQRGYRAVALGAMSLVAQIATIRRARHIVALHGAGLTHLIFAQPGCRVIEIFPASIGMEASRMAMMRLSRVFGHRHITWLEPGPSEVGGRGLSPGDTWNISIQPLLRRLVDAE